MCSQGGSPFGCLREMEFGLALQLSFPSAVVFSLPTFVSVPSLRPPIHHARSTPRSHYSAKGNGPPDSAKNAGNNCASHVGSVCDPGFQH